MHQIGAVGQTHHGQIVQGIGVKGVDRLVRVGVPEDSDLIFGEAQRFDRAGVEVDPGAQIAVHAQTAADLAQQQLGTAREDQVVGLLLEPVKGLDAVLVAVPERVHQFIHVADLAEKGAQHVFAPVDDLVGGRAAPLVAQQLPEHDRKEADEGGLPAQTESEEINRAFAAIDGIVKVVDRHSGKASVQTRPFGREDMLHYSTK